MKKKMLAAMLSATMVLTTVLTTNVSFAATNTDKFTDLSGHWGQSIINEAATLGVVGGYPEGYYLPDNLMKREEFYKLVTNVLTVRPNTSNITLAFKDADPIEWYIPTIKTAVAAGITKGYEDGTFGVGQMISRQEAAKVVASVIQTNNLDLTKNASTAKDAALIGDWALPYVNIMFQKGYMQGDNEGNFRPTMALTRAEAATLLLNVKKKETVIKGPNGSGIAVVPPAVDPNIPTGDAGCQKTHSVTAGAFTLGTGSSKDPYQISTAAQLNHVREHLNDGAFFQLTKDIEIKSDFATVVPAGTSNEVNWSSGNFVPIGSEQHPFVGNFDGNNHTISGMIVSGTVKDKNASDSDKPKASYAGLFGYVDKKSGIEKLTVKNAKVTGKQYVGTIVGYSLSDISDCSISSDCVTEGENYVGGIAGYAEAVLESNTNSGTVTAGYEKVGGIAGEINLEEIAVVDCVNKGSITGKSKVGGIVGSISGRKGPVTIKKCNNGGDIKATEYHAGGIAGIADGYSFSVAVLDCNNDGRISGDGINGGIAGYLKGTKSNIFQSVNEGAVNGNNAGGIVGQNEGRIEKCHNEGKVVGRLEAGGIVAFQEDKQGWITICYNNGTVIANSDAGGIIAKNGNTVMNCYNTGNVEGNGEAGGIAGRNEKYISVVYNSGDVKGSSSAGSLIGRNKGEISNSYWLLGSCGTDVGGADSDSGKQLVKVVKKEQLSGQEKIKTTKGYLLIIEIMNTDAGEKVWNFEYSATQSASDSKMDSAGNEISSSDLARSYIYPSLIALQR